MEAVKKVEPTSTKLTELKLAKKTAYDEMQKLEYDTEPWLAKQLEVYKLGEQIKAEIRNIEQEAKNAEVMELRNKSVARLDTFADLVIALETEMNRKGATIESKNAASEAMKAVKQDLANELLAKYPIAGVRTPASSTATNGTGDRGATGKRILDQFLLNRAAGMNDTDNKKAITHNSTPGGTGREEAVGTVGAVVLAWQKENGEK